MCAPRRIALINDDDREKGFLSTVYHPNQLLPDVQYQTAICMTNEILYGLASLPVANGQFRKVRLEMVDSYSNDRLTNLFHKMKALLDRLLRQKRFADQVEPLFLSCDLIMELIEGRVYYRPCVNLIYRSSLVEVSGFRCGIVQQYDSFIDVSDTAISDPDTEIATCLRPVDYSLLLEHEEELVGLLAVFQQVRTVEYFGRLRTAIFAVRNSGCVPRRITTGIFFKRERWVLVRKFCCTNNSAQDFDGLNERYLTQLVTRSTRSNIFAGRYFGVGSDGKNRVYNLVQNPDLNMSFDEICQTLGIPHWRSHL